MERIASQREMSKHLHLYLDNLGFSKQRCWERIHTMNKCSRAKDISTKRILNTTSIEKIFVGSQREGIGFDLLNDLDILQINHDVSCCTDPSLAHENAKVVFQLEQQNAPPEYCFLKLVSQNDNAKPFEYALEPLSGQYLSSALFMGKNDDVFLLGDGFISKNTHYMSPEGPSIPKYVEEGFPSLKTYLAKLNLKTSQMDYVRAFPCRTDHILHTWSLRERKYNWPSQKTIDHVISLPAHVVPVGQTGSAQQGLQWRICFTLAEIHLVQSFNNTQTKLFVLLKLIAKYYLKPVCACMTSYVMKTVVLWLAETVPQKKFRRKHLVARLYSALKLLQTSLQSGHLPSYMIPERNLYAGKLQVQEQQLVLAKLDFLLQNGSTMIHDFLFKPQEPDCQVDTILQGIFFANVCDKQSSCMTAVLTADEWAEYYTTMFLYKSKWRMLLYNIVFLIVPCVYTFGLDVVLPNDKTLEIPLKDKLTSDDRQKMAGNSSNNKKPEPDLDLFINEETEKDITLNDILRTEISCIIIDCGALIGSANSGGSVFAPLIHSNIVTMFLYILFALFIISEVVYMYKKSYSKQTYIENLENGTWEIRKYIPRSLQKAYRKVCTMFSCVATAFATIVVLSYPEILKDIPLGSLTLYLLVIQTFATAVRKLTYKPKIKRLHNSPSDKKYTKLLTDSVSVLTV